MYNSIFVPTLMVDEDKLKNAVSAARLLLSEGGTITLLHVIEEMPAYVDSFVPADVIITNTEEVNAMLREAATPLGDDLKTSVVKGHAGRTILSEAKETAADLIIVASHRPGLADYFLGSTASHVVRHSICPVLVLR